MTVDADSLPWVYAKAAQIDPRPEPIVIIWPRPRGLRWILFAFICHSDPTKVRVGERNLAERESDANQEHLAEKDDDVLEEVVALDASEVGAEKAKKKRKRKLTRDASGSGSAIPSDSTGPPVTASVTPISDVGLIPVADVLVVTVAVTTTFDANVAAGSKAKDASKDFEHIVDFASTGGVDADAASISKSKKPSISLDSFYASQSLDTETMKGELEDKRVKQTTLLSEKDAEIAHLKSLLSLKEVEAAEAISLRCQLSGVEAADVAKSTELRDLKEKNFALEGERNVLSERVETLKSVAASKEIELASLSSQVAKLTVDLSGFELSRDELDLKVVSLESERDCLATQKSSLESAFGLFKEQVEKMQDEQMRVLSDRVATIDSDLMEMVLHMDVEFYPHYLTVIAGRRWVLSRGPKLMLAKCLSSPEYLSTMGEAIGRAIDKSMQGGLAAGIEHGRAGRSITDVAAFNPSAESDYVAAINALQGVSFSLLAQLEANKDASMADVMDLLRLEGPAVETSEASRLQPSLDQLMILIHRLEDQVIIRETSLAFSLEVAHNRVQRLRGDTTAHRMSLTNCILPLVEPLSTRNLTGAASSSADLTTAVTTALSTTLVQTDHFPTVLSTEVPPSPKIVFEEEELDTTLEHEIELASLSSQVAKLTADMSGFQLSRDELDIKVASLESERDCLATQNRLRRCRMSNRVATIDSDLVEMVLHMDVEFYPHYLTVIAGRRWVLSRGLKLMLAKCLSSPEYLSIMGEAICRAIDKGMQGGLAAGIEHGRAERSITDVVAFNPSAESDYVAAINALQGPAVETSEASRLQPSLDQLMIPIHRLTVGLRVGFMLLSHQSSLSDHGTSYLHPDVLNTRSIVPLP
ncbi:hypothetical protein Tco_0858583 [Tanacetum coccineum]|uniref:Uncharacterized protein n=1 Tax=Tanacetum coccineum TaxID=301880 RepID=A0ABQ5B9I8_9ASTR